MKTKILILASLLTACVATQAVTINFGASVSNTIADAAGTEYNGNIFFEVGTYESATFTSLGGGSTTFFSGIGANATGNLNTSAIAGDQLAIRFFGNAAGTGDSFVLFQDKGDNAEWAVKSGDGGGLDLTSNNIDIADLTSGGGAALSASATLIGGTFGTAGTLGGGKFQGPTAVPEPSTFAALAGFLALGCVALRRRK